MIRTFLLLVLFAAQANEAAIRKALTPKLGGAKIEGVQPAPMAGLWEVRVRGRSGVQLLYTDAAGTFLIDGNLYDLKNDPLEHRNVYDDLPDRAAALRARLLDEVEE